MPPRLDSSTTPASDSRPHADYPAFLGYPQLGARHAVGCLLPRFLWIPKGWGVSTLDPSIHLTVQHLQVDAEVNPSRLRVCIKVHKPLHRTLVPWLAGPFGFVWRLMAVIGALFQSRGWLPIVEGPGYSRRPTSTLAMQLLNIGNHTLSFQTYEFALYSLKHWSLHLILLNIRVLTSSCQTLEFASYWYKHWNFRLIILNVGILTLSFQILDFGPYPFKHCR